MKNFFNKTLAIVLSVAFLEGATNGIGVSPSYAMSTESETPGAASNQAEGKPIPSAQRNPIKSSRTGGGRSKLPTTSKALIATGCIAAGITAIGLLSKKAAHIQHTHTLDPGPDAPTIIGDKEAYCKDENVDFSGVMTQIPADGLIGRTNTNTITLPQNLTNMDIYKNTFSQDPDLIAAAFVGKGLMCLSGFASVLSVALKLKTRYTYPLAWATTRFNLSNTLKYSETFLILRFIKLSCLRLKLRNLKRELKF